jgi:L-seryl-tRNA(Ser) seleniumtransferase
MKPLRQMPPVNDVFEHEALSHLGSILGQPFVARLLHEILERTRSRLRVDSVVTPREILTRSIAVELANRIESLLSPSFRSVINASGVILHTNLGRAPLPRRAIDHLRETSLAYSNLEFDLEGGGRGSRGGSVVRLICELLGSEEAVVVNNNAAAVLLVLNSLADGGEVVVSRGEEVEIGGSFRIPEVMLKSGARLREIGTTNRTRIEDYRDAVGPETRLLLRVHPSNFRVIGFAERPSLQAFVELGRSMKIPTFEDVGSGCLSPGLAASIGDEPLPQESIRAGVDVVCFSGDKLMGGPQAGIVAGRKVYIDRLRRNPLFRALRVDKLTLAAMEAVLLMHLRGETSEVPVLRMLMAEEWELRAKASDLALRIPESGVVPVSLNSVVGGGSVPGTKIPSWGLALSRGRLSLGDLEERFRKSTPPVITRIEGDQLLFDLRTVAPEEEDALLKVIAEVTAFSL